jgi:hypothetical protein
MMLWTLLLVIFPSFVLSIQQPAIVSIQNSDGNGLGFNVQSSQGAAKQVLSLGGNGQVDVNGNLTVNGTVTSANMALLSLKVDGIDYKDAYLALLAQMNALMAQSAQQSAIQTTLLQQAANQTLILQNKLNNLTVSCSARKRQDYFDQFAHGTRMQPAGVRVFHSGTSVYDTAACGEFYISGQHYCEFKPRSGGYFMMGVLEQRDPGALGVLLGTGALASGKGLYSASGCVYGDGGSISCDGNYAYGANDVIGVELDMDLRRVRFKKNGGTPNSWNVLAGSSYAFGVTHYTGEITELLWDKCAHSN